MEQINVLIILSSDIKMKVQQMCSTLAVKDSIYILKNVARIIGACLSIR